MDGGGDLWWCAVLELVLSRYNDYVGSHSGFFPDLWGLGLGFLPTLILLLPWKPWIGGGEMRDAHLNFGAVERRPKIFCKNCCCCIVVPSAVVDT